MGFRFMVRSSRVASTHIVCRDTFGQSAPRMALQLRLEHCLARLIPPDRPQIKSQSRTREPSLHDLSCNSVLVLLSLRRGASLAIASMYCNDYYRH